MKNQKIIIFGGTGSLGNKLTEKFISDNELYLYSRDECKHWNMNINYNNHKNLNFIIGDIINKEKVEQSLLRHNFDVIIMAAAMKHIDKCEFETNECINTNLLGNKNILDIIETKKSHLTNLKTVCFVSTDKACSPINVYGMCKSISELLMVEKSKYIKNIKFVSVRYGNVLNSRGSIIPKLHKIGLDQQYKNYTITDKRMTRFVMTLEQSVELIMNAINNGESGDIVIPKLVSCKVIDLIEIFSEIYNKPILNGKLRPGEKMLESLINETQSMRLVKDDNGYSYIKPCYKNIECTDLIDYNSKLNPMSKEELKEYLINLNLIENNLIKFNISKKDLLIDKPFPFLKKNNILDHEFAKIIQNEILNIPDDEWDRYDNPFENKFTLRNKDNLPKNCSILFKYLTSNEILDKLSFLFGIKLLNDETKNWWGIHKYDHGDKLDIHVDAGLHPITKNKKQVTLGIYLSRDWKQENGGHLELWEGENSVNNNAKLIKCVEKILPLFNTLVLFKCNDYAWHGNPHPVNCKNGEKRIFLTISYISENYSDLNKREKAFFVKHPNEPDNEEKDKLRLLRADPIKYKEVYRI